MSEFGAPSGQEFDPYRYGAPAPAGAGNAPTGRLILRESWRLMRADPEMIVLPLVGAVASIVAFLILFVPGLVVGVAAGGSDEAGAFVGGVLGLFAASCVAIFFQAALVAGATMRADGQDPDLGSTLAAAGKHWRRILGWAALTTTVGTVIRVVEQRLGFVGAILGFLGGVAWAVATFFVIPALVIEGIGPVEALKRSSGVIRQVWGTSVRTTLRFGLIQLVILVPVAVFVVGLMRVAGGGAETAAGITLMGIGGIAFFVMAVVFGAIGTYARTLIYRYATGRPVPGIDAALFAGAFRARRGRR